MQGLRPAASIVAYPNDLDHRDSAHQCTESLTEEFGMMPLLLMRGLQCSEIDLERKSLVKSRLNFAHDVKCKD
jgi:hypothetical protein